MMLLLMMIDEDDVYDDGDEWRTRGFSVVRAEWEHS